MKTWKWLSLLNTSFKRLSSSNPSTTSFWPFVVTLARCILSSVNKNMLSSALSSMRIIGWSKLTKAFQKCTQPSPRWSISWTITSVFTNILTSVTTWDCSSLLWLSVSRARLALARRQSRCSGTLTSHKALNGSTQMGASWLRCNRRKPQSVLLATNEWSKTFQQLSSQISVSFNTKNKYT